MKINNIPLIELKKYVYLDDTVLRWLFTDNSRTKGAIVGCKQKRYYQVGINRTYYKVHRLIYQIHNNIEDLGETIIDHIDGDTFNNDPNNLRICNQSQNSRNRKKPNTNTTGYKGITQDKNGKYRVRVITDSGRITIGRFDNIEKAAQAYTQAAKLHHGLFFKNPD